MNTLTDIPRLPGPGDERVFAIGATRDVLEKEILPGYIARCRWFGAKARQPRRFVLRDFVALGTSPTEARLGFVEIEYEEGAADLYLLPLQIATGEDAAMLQRAEPGAIVARYEDGAVLSDALHHESFRKALFELMAGSGGFIGEAGRIKGAPGAILGHHTSTPTSRALSVEQSNSSIIYGEHVFLKLYRRLEAGVNPDAEILRFLGARSFPHVPPFGGAIEYRGADGETRVLALALGLVPNDGDAWSFTLRHLADYFSLLHADDRDAAKAAQAGYLIAAAELGTRTGELHVALASAEGTPSFVPEPLTPEDGADLSTALRAAIGQVGALLAERRDALDAATRELARRFHAAEPALMGRADALGAMATSAAKIRTHGDYHLGQVLHGPDGFVIIDFEGEPLRSLAERRRKMSPFRDVAGMLRSFHYAAYAALEPLGDARGRLAADAEAWARVAQQTFLDAWLASTRGAVFRDPDPDAERSLLDAFLLEKALYEVRYEVNNRPGWLGIPLRGVLALIEDAH